MDTPDDGLELRIIPDIFINWGDFNKIKYIKMKTSFFKIGKVFQGLFFFIQYRV